MLSSSSALRLLLALAMVPCAMLLRPLARVRPSVVWNRGAAAWSGEGRSQAELMESDACLVVDEADGVLGGAAKKMVHGVTRGTPRGMLHRAFSVFLFDAEGRMLLQRRAGDKITFPGVWTNACCSHQLRDMTPDEEDNEVDVSKGKAPGTAHAAVRKLRHELGVETSPEALGLRFLTRLHYWAIDTETHGEDSPWAEHEVDYIMLGRAPEGGLEIRPNDEEVQDTRWVTEENLEAMIEDDAHRWSPWFRIVATDPLFLPRWWRNLDALAPMPGAEATSADFDVAEEHPKIYRMDPDPKFMGKAGPWLSEKTTVK